MSCVAVASRGLPRLLEGLAGGLRGRSHLQHQGGQGPLGGARVHLRLRRRSAR